MSAASYLQFREQVLFVFLHVSNATLHDVDSNYKRTLLPMIGRCLGLLPQLALT